MRDALSIRKQMAVEGVRAPGEVMLWLKERYACPRTREARVEIADRDRAQPAA